MAQRAAAIPVGAEDQISCPQQPAQDLTASFPAASSRTRSLELVHDSLNSAGRDISRAFSVMSARVRRFCNERPLYVLAFVAGISVLAGAALRTWRSRRYD